MVSDEILSETFRMYPCIYDKKTLDMDKLCVSNSWNEIKQKCSNGDDVPTVTVPGLGTYHYDNDSFFVLNFHVNKAFISAATSQHKRLM